MLTLWEEGNTVVLEGARVGWLHEVEDPEHAPKHLMRELGEPIVALKERWLRGPHWEVERHKPMMNDDGQSDGCIVPTKFPNKTAKAEAEGMEGRRPTKGNELQGPMCQTQGWRKT